jgi:hypothetical protein
MADQVGGKSLGSAALVRLLNSAAELLLQRDQPLHFLLRVNGRSGNALGEEADPTIPVPVTAQALKFVLIEIAAALKPGGNDEEAGLPPVRATPEG